MTAGIVHIVGAGMAGLACAVRIVARGGRVRLYEASSRAGGRCRSFHDARLDRVIDNGNHILLAGNRAVNHYLDLIGGQDGLTTIAPAAFPFLDLNTGERWTLRPGAGRIPWWLARPDRRPPGTRTRDFLAAAGLALAGADATVADALRGCSAQALRRFWEPLAVAVLNTPVAEGAARLLWPVLRETFLKGEAACRPRVARHGLGAAFVDPALRFLAARGAEVRLSQPVRGVVFDGGRPAGLDLDDGPLPFAAGDALVLAVPPRAAVRLLPGLDAPLATRAIVNGHFRLDEGFDSVRILGLVGGFSHWIFVRGDVASVTISAGDAESDLPADEIARRMWRDIRVALDLPPAPLPPHRIIKEKMATLDQSPRNVRNRPGTVTNRPGIRLAGDWTDTGLPATIEGAIRSGFAAADVKFDED